MKIVKPYYNPHARCRLAAKMGGTDLIVLYAILIFEIFTKFLKNHENCKAPYYCAYPVPKREGPKLMKIVKPYNNLHAPCALSLLTPAPTRSTRFPLSNR